MSDVDSASAETQSDVSEGDIGDDEFSVNLPPRVRTQPKLDDDGNPTGETEQVVEEQDPGNGGDIDLVWGAYFSATPTDLMSMAQMLQIATGMQVSFLARRSAVDVMASAFSRDGAEEWERLSADERQKQASLGAAFAGDPGGAMPGHPPAQEPDEGAQDAPGSASEPSGDPSPTGAPQGPPGAPGGPPVKPGAAQPGKPNVLTLAPTDLALVVTVNEVRAAQGLGPLMRDGAPSSDGDLTIGEFKAKHKDTVATGAAAASGKDSPAPGTPPPPKVVAPGGAFGAPHPGVSPDVPKPKQELP